MLQSLRGLSLVTSWSSSLLSSARQSARAAPTRTVATNALQRWLRAALLVVATMSAYAWSSVALADDLSTVDLPKIEPFELRYSVNGPGAVRVSDRELLNRMVGIVQRFSG